MTIVNTPIITAPTAALVSAFPAHAVVIGVPFGLREHQHEQKRHQDGAGVDDDRGHAQELRPLKQEQPAVPNSVIANQMAQ